MPEGVVRESIQPSEPFSRAFAGESDVVIAKKIPQVQRRVAGADFRRAMLTRAELDSFEKKEHLANERKKASAPEAVARRRARWAAIDERTVKLKEQSKAKNPEAVARHKKALENFDARTDEILSKKNRLWKNLVETYLAGGEEALEKELFDPRREGKTLTREMLEKDKPLQKQLAVMFVADSKKRTITDFILSFPTEQDYVNQLEKRIYSPVSKDDSFDKGALAELDNAPQKPQDKFDVSDIETEIFDTNDRKNKSSVIVDSEYQDEVALAIQKGMLPAATLPKKKPTNVNIIRREKISENAQQVERARQAYVEAYKNYDSQSVAGMTENEIALLKPPLFAGFLRSANSPGKNLKRLYEELQDAKSYALSEAAAKNLAASSLVKNPKNFLAPELQQAAQEINIRDEKTITAKQQQINDEVDKALDATVAPLIPLPKFFAREAKPGETARYLQAVKARSKMNPNFQSPLTEKMKGKSLGEGLEYMQQIENQRLESIKNRMSVIEAFFADKNPLSKTKTVRQYLLGEDIKGWFKGGQKQMQREYKNLYNSPVYQKMLKK